MAALTRAVSEPNLAGLEEDLTCSICLSLFDTPVTVPCGHNFCASCLDLTWAELDAGFSCPQCRTTFPGRPQLRKNTVLCRVVEQLQGCTAAEEQQKQEDEEDEAVAEEAASPVYCDSCLQAHAAQTCLTCMASFCAEHLQPHHDSPAFRDHQLCPPVRDLQQRKCSQHNKVFEFFCKQHGTCICSLCLLSHKLCNASPLQQAKAEAESALKKKLTELHNHSEKATRAMNSVKTSQTQTAETAARKRDLMRNEFLEIKALIEEKENQIFKVIMEEEKRVCTKFDYIYTVLGSKKNEIQSLRDQIEMALTEHDDVLFLKRAAALQRASTKEVFVPVIEMDQNLIHTAYQSAINLKEMVKLTVSQPKEKKTEGCYWPSWPQGHSAGLWSSGCLPGTPGPFPLRWSPTEKQTARKAKPPQAAALNRPVPGRKPVGPQRPNKEKKPSQVQEPLQEEADNPDKKFSISFGAPNMGAPSTAATTAGASKAATAANTKDLISSFLQKDREELLQYAANITLDFNTAHNKVHLSERYTKMSVSDTPLNYNHHPQRFTYCSQVLGFQCFKRGIHYWEVELQQKNFCAIGICYGSMDREGPDSRLGRNSSSWCIEWFNSKISAWHNDVEKNLPNVKATKIGVLLHCEGGFVIFLAVGEKLNLIYKFKTQFTEALYPAFWVFSSGTVLSLCQMKK
ncbi:E3 ubiquitin/ISG15 ligase TRIM25 isoform X1 [Anas platyrhynchos]|uniref:E3 ubiquitin/ISG15 ligase TRIM25 isoform X1 n=1 Tax=Anas platyrhynchos TaxID=8839 RepID=UPI000F7CA678|eukprot:XP_005012382.2 E3 ubiquitin/ISG15 ligase TRIM25 isoform X1 [Anas platyrhynchos]